MNSIQLINSFEIFYRRLDITLSRFPNHQKFAARQDLDNKTRSVWERIVRMEMISSNKRKIGECREILKELHVLQAQIRLCKSRGFLGYLTSKDLEKLPNYSTRRLTEAEEQKRSALWEKNAEMEFFKLTRMLTEVYNKILVWIEEHKQ